MDEEHIVDLIRKRNFSELYFIEEKENLEKKYSYYGFLYFILDLKEERTDSIVDKIIKREGSISKAYEYLGDVASIIYTRIDENIIPLGFYNKSIEEDNNNSESWFKLFNITGNISHLYESLRSHKIKNEKKEISKKLEKYRHINYNSTGLKKSCWKEMIEIVNDTGHVKNDRIKGLLSLAYFHTGKIKKGIKKIRQSKKVDPYILINYLNLKYIEKEEAASKVHEFQLNIIFPDPKENYKQTKNLLKKQKIEIGKEELIRKAFKAEFYNDVIDIYNKPYNTENVKAINLDSELYMVLSRMLLEMETDKVLLESFNNRKNKNRRLITDKGTLLIFEIMEDILSLRENLNSKKTIESPLSMRGEYHKIKNSLDDINIIYHNLYGHLVEEKNKLKEEWDNRYNRYMVKSGMLKNEGEKLAYRSIIAFCAFGIDHSLFDEVLDKLFSYHEKNTPTSMTLNYIGVCFERKGEIDNAFHYYEQAALLSENKKERDYILIINLLRASKRSEKGLDAEDFSLWKSRFNSYLVSSFQWSLFFSNTKTGRLYKYSDFNMNTLDSIDSQYFYMAKKSQLNDPIEMPEILTNEEYLIESDYRVCSFSRNENSMLMWSHYSNNHQGIMVEYQFGSSLPASTGIGKVQYTNNQVRNIEESQYTFNQYLLTKNNEWSYEEEVRLMSYCIDKVYYEKHQHPNPDRSKVNAFISSITLGYNFPKSKINMIINLVKKINESRVGGEENIKLRKAIVSKENLFSLDYIDLDI